MANGMYYFEESISSCFIAGLLNENIILRDAEFNIILDITPNELMNDPKYVRLEEATNTYIYVNIERIANIEFDPSEIYEAELKYNSNSDSWKYNCIRVSFYNEDKTELAPREFDISIRIIDGALKLLYQNKIQKVEDDNATAWYLQYYLLNWDEFVSDEQYPKD